MKSVPGSSGLDTFDVFLQSKYVETIRIARELVQGELDEAINSVDYNQPRLTYNGPELYVVEEDHVGLDEGPGGLQPVRPSVLTQPVCSIFQHHR